MPTREEIQALAVKLHGLAKEPELLRKAAARLLARMHPVDANELLDALITLYREGWHPAACVLPAFAQALELEAQEVPELQALARISLLQSLERVQALFAEGAPRKELNKGAAAKADAVAFSESLGHLKHKARTTRDRDALTKLAMSSHPAVVGNVLMNPRLTEDWVVRMAAKRPSRPEPLLEIWRSQRWGNRPAVRRALVFNPYLPPNVGAKIVPLLATADLAALAQDGSVHPSLKEQAVQLLRGPGRGESSS